MGIVDLDFGTLAENDGDTLAVAFPKVQNNFEDLDTRATANAAAIAAHIVDADAHTQYVKTSSLSESIDDRVAALLVAGTNVTLTYNDAANTLEIASTGGGATNLAYAATRTALKALDTTSVKFSFLGEYPRYGVFVWRAGNFAARVTADPLEGRYLKADAIATTAGAWERVDSEYYVEQWGAVGDNATNDAPAIQAAIDFFSLQSITSATVRFQPKVYSVAAQITVPQGINLIGSGVNAGTRLNATHSAGAVVHLNGGHATMQDMEVIATSARTNGSMANGSAQNCGILITELYCKLIRTRAFFQPSHGVLCSTDAYMAALEDVTSSNNKGHGICLDPGDENGDTPTVPGLTEIIRPSINANGGHAICVGRPSSSGVGASGLRVSITMADINDNGQNPALLHKETVCYFHGVNISMRMSALAGGPTKRTYGIYAQGESHTYEQNRFFNLKSDTQAYIVDGGATTGIVIDGINVDTAVAVLATAVSVGATVPARAVTVRPRVTNGYTTLMTSTTEQTIDLGVDSDIQHFTTPGAFTWTKPEWAIASSVVEISICSGGGGGGSGRRGAATSVRCGGGGGGTGVFIHTRTNAGSLSATVSVTVGAGGAGGAAVTANGTNGNNGTAGGASLFGTFRAFGGNAGSGGTATTGTAGAAIGVASMFTAAGIAGGAASTTGAVGIAGGAATLGSSAGGGSGGGITSADAVSNGGAGGALSFPMTTATATGGTAGTAGGNGGAGSAGAIIHGRSMGSGGGGGASSITAAAGNGGNGINGSGGGGGGASLDGFNSGAGGNGGDGWVTIVTYK